MTEQRPRPQYGEYASTEERLAAGGLPLEDAPPRPETRIDPTAVKAPAPDPAIAGPAAYPWDRALTVALLAFGAISVIRAAPGLLDFSSTLREVYETADLGVQYSNDALADGIGIAVFASQVVLFALTLLLSMRRLRTGRRAFVVPLIGGVVAGIITLVLMIAAMVGDPAFTTLMNSPN